MNGRKIAGMLGFAARARQTAAGMEACRILARSGQCGVMLIDSGTAANTRKKAEDLSRETHTPAIVLPAGMIESATGKQNMVISVRKGSFSDQILSLSKGQPVHNPGTGIMNPESTMP